MRKREKWRWRTTHEGRSCRRELDSRSRLFILFLSLYTCLLDGMDEGGKGGWGIVLLLLRINRHMHVRMHARVRVVESGMEH